MRTVVDFTRSGHCKYMQKRGLPTSYRILFGAAVFFYSMVILILVLDKLQIGGIDSALTSCLALGLYGSIAFCIFAILFCGPFAVSFFLKHEEQRDWKKRAILVGALIFVSLLMAWLWFLLDGHGRSAKS